MKPVFDQVLLIFGAGTHARKVARALLSKGYRVLGFVSSRPGADWIDELPVYSWSSLEVEGIPSTTQLLFAIFNRNDPYAELVALANRHGFDRLLMPWDYYPALESELGWCYWLSPKHSSDLNPTASSASYLQVLGMLADEESRETFHRIHAFRRGEDLAFSEVTSADPQYFNDLTLTPLAGRPPITYLDIGAYNGDTLLSLADTRPVGRAILFEPDSANYADLQSNLIGLHRLHPSITIEALPLALGNDDRFVPISGTGEAASLQGAVGAPDARLIRVVRGDQLFPFEKVDFIKVDAEGSDLNALLGMAELIRRSRPILAVSLYHKPQDLIELPIAICALLKGLPYRFYLRQHMYNSFDSVYYAVPCS